MKPFDFLVLEKLIAADTVNDTALALGANRQQVMRWRARGLDDTEARDLAERAGFEPGEVWDELADGATPVAKPQSAPAAPRPAAARPAKPESDDEIVWCDPPIRGEVGHRSGASKVLRILTSLVERPGEWARIALYDSPKKAHTRANSLRSRRTVKPSGRWEFVGRTLPDDPNRGGVWARYLGPDE